MDWRDWLTDDRLLGLQEVQSTALLMLVALAGSLLSSLLISFLYVHFFGGRATGSRVHRAFLLLGPSITAIFIAIQFSLPLSLGLLGALSIVRFRMPIKEAEEIGFLLLVVAVSLSWATLNVRLLGLLLVVAIAGLWLTSVWPGRDSGGDGMVVVTLPSIQYARNADALLSALEAGPLQGKLEAVSETDDESTVSYRFSRLDRAGMLDLRQRVAKISDDATTQFYFHRSSS